MTDTLMGVSPPPEPAGTGDDAGDQSLSPAELAAITWRRSTCSGRCWSGAVAVNACCTKSGRVLGPVPEMVVRGPFAQRATPYKP